MAEWRFLSRWPEGELAARLEAARALVRNFDVDGELTAERGWNIIHSRSRVAREVPGPPLPGGTFERLWEALQRLHHSDPRIVIAHFRDDLPLADRRVLLELKGVGLRFLCPAVISVRHEVSDPASTVRGFSFETLEGHIERGREWFFLEKDHANGDIRFRIEAAWDTGEFPNWWSHLGFHLVGRRYQRAWHRLAHLRLRRVAAGLDPGAEVGPDHVAHEGPPMPAEPVQFFAQPGMGRLGVDVEEEVEEMNTRGAWRAIGLGALSGVRSMVPPAVVVRRLRNRRARRTPGGLPRVLGALALGELIADKLPFTPPRIRAPSVLARIASGAFAGSRVAPRGGSALLTGVLGGVAALAATRATYRLRGLAIGRSRLLGYAVAVAEDALALWGGRRLAASARP